jgi:hypothetical protein
MAFTAVPVTTRRARRLRTSLDPRRRDPHDLHGLSITSAARFSLREPLFFRLSPVHRWVPP